MLIALTDIVLKNINTGSSNINIASPIPNDPSMHSLEATGIFDDAYDDRKEVSAEADLNNLETTMNVIQALTDPSWIEAIQEKLLQFKLQKVWTLVDLPKGKRATGTKWVYRNKKDERGIIVRNKARLVETKQDWLHKMDVKSAFLYGTIKEEVYVCQPPGFEDPQFPDKVYKVEKALYGLHQAPRAWYETLSTYLLENGFRRGTIDKTLFIKKDKGELTFFLGLQVKQKDDRIFISQDKYVAYILKKFDFAIVKTASTLIKPNKALIKDTEAEDVDVQLYRSMIGSLMFQVTPKVLTFHAVMGGSF
ncbi:putative ribonuclease H-like domain-containing protein [Tanacetum coccineum]